MLDTKDKKYVTVNLPENVQVDYEFEKKLKNFIKDVKKLGIIEEVRRRRYYVKKSELKRLENKKKKI